MDQASGSPEPRERAVSSEPCSTRPNPFDDGDLSSRKRRRTSLSGSRSRSIETVRSLQDVSSPGNLDNPAPDSTMRVDADPATPQTPDPQPSTAATPADPPSSRVTTINLRSSHRGSSPLSPTPRGTLIQPRDGPDDVKISVEDPEVGMTSIPLQMVDTPQSSSSSSEIGSPEVEVVAVQDEDDLSFTDPEVTLLNDDDALSDPISRFPYIDPVNETFHETVTKLVNYLSAHSVVDNEVFSNLKDWIDKWIRYAISVGYDGAIASIQAHRSFWQLFPDIIWAMNNKKPPILKPLSPNARGAFDLFFAFARLTAMMNQLDFKTLEMSASPSFLDDRAPDLLSPLYMSHLHTITRGPDAVLGRDWIRDEDLFELLDYFANQRGGSIQSIAKLLSAMISLIPRFPKLADNLGPACHMVADILRESNRHVPLGTLDQRMALEMQKRYQLGHILFNIASAALSDAIDKHVSLLTSENTIHAIQSLTDIYHFSLQGSHKMAIEVLREHQRSHPKLGPRSAQEAVAWEWRFNMFGKLIMCSQMQLRVNAVTNMCSDLVGFWKRCNDTPDDKGSPLLSFFAEYLLRTKLVEYILGPACHPEITAESGNIVGFLLVTRFYQKEQTDLFWQTVTTSENTRVVDALIRMMGQIAHLQDMETSQYIWEKFQTLSMADISAGLRTFGDSIVLNMTRRCQAERTTLKYQPYRLCLRLLRESSVCGPQTQVAFPEIQNWAMSKFRDLIAVGPDMDGRQELYLSCIQDLADRSPTTLGSIWALSAVLRQHHNHDFRLLTAEHGLARLLVDELEFAIAAGRAAGVPTVLSGASNHPRREFLYAILINENEPSTDDLAQRLWDLLVCRGALCSEDRNFGWQILNSADKRTRFENTILKTCFTEYLPCLPAEYLCQGTLEFIRERILNRVNDAKDIVLDDHDSVEKSGIEQLWRLILCAPDEELADQAIGTLVTGVYVDSKTVMTYSPHRARDVHLDLVNKCLGQLGTAAKKLRAFSDGTMSGDDEPMVIVATDTQIQEQERIFLRSLAVLRSFLQAHQSTAHFSVPDLRTLMPPSPNLVEGESAELKFQSFDGDKQTEVKPLHIGRRNTAASLLASLREATGFDNYRVYYRGQAFLPGEKDICKSLEDLQIHNGLILVKREEPRAIPQRIKPGASPLEIEILTHFSELWDYLSMEDKLAKEIYEFLTKLPADDHLLNDLDSQSTSYGDIFPAGQPYRSLYAMYAIREYISSARRLADASVDEDASTESLITEAVTRTMSLVIAAMSDSEVIDRSSSREVEMKLLQNFVDCYMFLLKDYQRDFGDANVEGLELPLDRLLEILFAALAYPGQERIGMVTRTIKAILLSCTLNAHCWDAFRDHPMVTRAVQECLLDDPQSEVRDQSRELIEARIKSEDSEFSEFLWPILWDMVPAASTMGMKGEGVLVLAHTLLRQLVAERSPIVNMALVAKQSVELLLKYETIEEIGQVEPHDIVASSLIDMLHCCVESSSALAGSATLPSTLAKDLFWRHAFPPQPSRNRLGDPVAKVLLRTVTRERLWDILFALVKGDRDEFEFMVRDLISLVPYERNDDDVPYNYDLIPQFERAKAVRSPAGYVGLRNLSNTCYLNSLFTQLFMNTHFRRFILGATIGENAPAQSLLFQTQKLFAYMQSAYLRYVDPALVVQSIKTYDDTTIDVHNQMDVDEFYNLLFDRFESQLLTVEERRKFRTFYGGQLVQQVSSKECEHISERLEPFAAIQCDIKGKSTLQESLQAYVGGEIMEGDNKYKCSTCDRHVDAVKRACLRDIPDSLIFHLKRFDFNLRSMQRSKINEYFSFPRKIDMRPYTIDHLTNPDSGSEDIFELVGILVHSGTAESGHYYSYIRERPSMSDTETWLEFNDDVVTSWDPAQMESSTFGGPDYRSTFDSNGLPYDKVWSAYMLFYQRASSLDTDQADLLAREESTPLQVPVPPAMADHIREDNTLFLRRHCLYDPAHVPFVKEMFRHAPRFNGGGECSDDHELENIAMEMALGHLDQVVSRTKDVPEFARYAAEMLSGRCRNCAKCCYAFYDYFYERPESFRQLVQRNPEPSVRKEVGNLFIQALEHIRDRLPHLYAIGGTPDPEYANWGLPKQPVVRGVASLFDPIWLAFHMNIRAWHECFYTMNQFAQLGPMETAALLAEDYLVNALRIIWADASMDLPPQYHRMLTAITRRMASRPPAYDTIIQFISTLMEGLQPHFELSYAADTPGSRFNMWVRSRRPLQWTSSELLVLTQEWNKLTPGSVFVEKLIAIDQEHQATDTILERLIPANKFLDAKIFYVLKSRITGQMSQLPVPPYLRAAGIYCQHSQNSDLVFKLIRHVGHQSRNIVNNEGAAFFEFFKEVVQDYIPGAGDSTTNFYLNAIASVSTWAPGLLGYYDINLRSEVEEFLRERLFQYGTSPEFSEDEGGVARATAMVVAARLLGVSSVEYVRENYVNRRVQVAKESVAALQRVIAQCARYFVPVGEDGQSVADEQFAEQSRAVLDNLRRILVDEVEEDGSGMSLSLSDSDTVTPEWS